MNREWLLLLASVAATLALALGLLRLLAPELLGIAPDLVIVRSSEEVVPFYDGVFRDAKDAPRMLRDPHTLVRMRPFLPFDRNGPTDLLGFRNRAVPHRADVIVLGDSQTFGVGVELEENWPSRLRAALGEPAPAVYAMATGGWGAVQYLDLFGKALAFRPAVVVVAFYSGNDPMESFRLAYGVERWADLRPDPALALDDRPRLTSVEREGVWSAPLAEGEQVSFKPLLRLYSNRKHASVDAGWQIMAEVARRIAATGRARGVRPVFTILPTKELVFAPRIQREEIRVPPDYVELVRTERRRIGELAQQLDALEGSSYVDVLRPLEQAVLAGGWTHPQHADGHPKPLGHRVIARAIAPVVEQALEQAGRAPAPGS